MTSKREIPEMKKVVLSLAALAACVACSRVPAGYEGVKVNLYGSDKGVQAKETGVGWVWVGPGHELYTFPTFTQNVVWTASRDEGSPNDESISFQDKEGLVLNADVGLSYYIEPGKADEVYVKYRRGIDEITDIFLRNMVRDALVEKSSTMTAEEAYSTRKIELLRVAEESVRTQVEPYGIHIEKLFWIGPIRLPPAVKEAVDGKIEATQLAQKKQNEVATARAEADKAIEAARGRAESTRLEAQARADAITVEGDALRKNPEVLRLREIEKWDGVYPSTLVTGDSQPFLMLDGKKE